MTSAGGSLVLAELRRREILATVHADGSVQTVQTAHHLGVSQMTIRRDIEALFEERLLRRVRGGAVRIEPERHAPLGPAVSPDQSRSLAAAARELVTDGMVIGLAGGSTLPELARAICALSGVTIVSNSLLVARLIEERASNDLPFAQLLLTGGTREGTDALVGPVALATLRTLNTDLAFIDAAGVDVVDGFTCRTPEEAEVLSAFASRASRTVVLAPDSALGVTRLCEIKGITRADVIVASQGISLDNRESLRRLTKLLLLAPVTNEWLDWTVEG